jgi:hypothetical protein
VRNSSGELLPGALGFAFQEAFVLLPLVVVVEPHLRWTALCPLEDDAPLVVHANAVPPPKVPLEGFEPIAWRSPQIVQVLSRVQHIELSEDPRPKSFRNTSCSPRAPTVEKILSESIAE